MATEYEIWLSSPFGTRVQVIPHEAILKLEYSLSVNAPGILTATIDREAIDDAYVVTDAQLEV